MHTNSKLLFQKYALEYFERNARVLEIGPDGFPSTFQSIAKRDSAAWHTLDIYQHDQLTYSTSSEYEFPVADSSYDVVLSGQVVEHVRKVWVWMKELARVCKPGGVVITIGPVSWPYHEAPIDCWRIFPEGMKALYDEAGLDVRLSTWESLERPGVRRRLPGRSVEAQSRPLQLAYGVLGTFGFPVECAFDIITIGRKPRV